MISLFGNITLFLALIFSLLQSLIPLWGMWRRHRPYALAFARPAALGQFICVAAAYLLLMLAFVTNDFSISYVAANSHAALPLMYRLTAVWGGHEGSILLWILILNSWTMIFLFNNSFHDKDKIIISCTLAILGLLSFCFLCFLLLTSNPFLATATLQTARDLNPLLQDPGFIFHPPFLYMGYVGFSAAFALTLAALICHQLNATWARTTRQFALAAWCFLTVGILLGSWWAYRVLGWGGFWFWDPVENASLLPWLAGTALIHVLIIVEKRQLAQQWAALLALITFALSVLGTFLVRSGMLVSVHTFASDPTRGIFLLLLLTILVIAAFVIYIVKLPKASSHSQQKIEKFTWLSRECGMLLNSILLFTAMLTILLGTLYPLIVETLHLGSISVGAPYFNTVMLPFVFAILFLMATGPLCAWQQQTFKNAWQPAAKNLIVSMVIALILLWGTTGHSDWLAWMSLSLSSWVILNMLSCARFSPGMACAHIGFAVLVIGVLLSSVLHQERDVRLQVGDRALVGPYQFLFISTEGIQGPNYRGIRASFEVTKNQRHIINLYPEKRIYTVRDMVMTKVDIHPGIFRDLYIALGEPIAENDWTMRLYYKPFIRWIWFGGLLMMLGGVITLFSRQDKT